MWLLIVNGGVVPRSKIYQGGNIILALSLWCHGEFLSHSSHKGTLFGLSLTGSDGNNSPKY